MGPYLGLKVRRPNAHTAVISALGELDETTTPRLEELLHARLNSTIGTVVLDFSGLQFVGMAAVRMLLAASRKAQARHINLRLIEGPPCVERALRAAGLTDHFDREVSHHVGA
jgi:anti-anti-sigma factor